MMDDLPFRPVRLMLNNGMSVVIERREQAIVGGLTIVLWDGPGEDERGRPDYRLVSIPNIVLARACDPPADDKPATSVT